MHVDLEDRLALIAELNPRLNALLAVDPARVRAAAAGVPEGPLRGVTVTVKDNVDIAGEVTACGSAAHGGVRAERDATVVARLRAAGAVLVGRANMDELAMGASTQTSAYGPTRNPLDPRRSPGGSSGGCAAAVAAGMVEVAVGTDTGGSIREPAAQCGIVGMAPSPGLVPLDGVVPFAPELDRCGPLATDVASAATLLAVIADRPDLAVVPPLATRLRVGVITELGGPLNQSGVLDALDRSIRTLQGNGVDVVGVSVPAARAGLDTYITVSSVAALPVLDAWAERGPIGDEVARRRELAGQLVADAATRSYAERARRLLRAQMRSALADCDLLLCPTMPTTAPLLDGGEHADLIDPLIAPYTDCWTVLANLAGLASLSVPAGISEADGMPVGVMLTALPGQDRTLLTVGRVLETLGS